MNFTLPTLDGRFAVIRATEAHVIILATFDEAHEAHDEVALQDRGDELLDEAFAFDC